MNGLLTVSRPVFVALFLMLIVPGICRAEKLALSVNSEAAILINADTGAILYEKNSHAHHYPASITKVITAIIALPQVSDKFDDMIAADQDCIGTVTEEALRRSNYTMPAYLLIPGGSHIGIKKGEELSLKDLFYGMMLASGDDAANIIAKYVGGTIPTFVEQMNAFVKELGCQDTNFCNPHGLHHPKQHTSAFDMALIAREAMKNELFREIVSTVSYTRPKTNKQEPTLMMQGNRLLRKGPFYYSKAIGIKTGYYSLAGSTIVAAAKDGDRTLILVLLKSPDRKNLWSDSKKIFEAAFSQPKVQRILLKKGPQKFELALAGGEQPIKTFINEDFALEYYPAEEPKVKCLLFWDKTLQLPVAKDQRVGELSLQAENGQVWEKIPLYAQEDVKATWVSRTKNSFTNNVGSTILKVVAVIAVVFVLGFFAIRFRR